MSNRKDDLFGGRSPQNAPKRVWGKPVEETSTTKDLNDNQVLELQRREIDDQDRALDDLSRSVGTIKQISLQIGNETEEQIGLLDDLDERIDKTNARVRNTTKRVEKVHTKSSTKCMWAVIIVLFIGLIVVGILAIKM